MFNRDIFKQWVLQHSVLSLDKLQKQWVVVLDNAPYQSPYETPFTIL